MVLTMVSRRHSYVGQCLVGAGGFLVGAVVTAICTSLASPGRTAGKERESLPTYELVNTPQGWRVRRKRDLWGGSGGFLTAAVLVVVVVVVSLAVGLRVPLRDEGHHQPSAGNTALVRRIGAVLATGNIASLDARQTCSQANR